MRSPWWGLAGSLGLALGMPLAVCAQVAVGAPDTAAVAAEPGDVLGSARSLQASFERTRERHMPLTFARGGGDCDEVVGRFCTWYDEGEWVPTPEPDELREARASLLGGLDSLHALAPRDEWIHGQRVWYRADGGDWEGALDAARDCGAVAPWWCTALEGLALHGLRRFAESESAFDTALDLMDPEIALEWKVPERAVDGDGRDVLETLVTAADGSLEPVLDRLWSLADPLYLVEGNDRMTAHYARWTVATLKKEARNPYRMRWGSDLEELTVRHGWEVGWERSRSTRIGSPDGVTGHKEPEARDYLPPGIAFADPANATEADLTADRREPESLYAPPYAPVLLPMEGQVAFFPRGDRLAVVTTHFLPDDTTFHADHDHPRPWMDAGEQAGMPDRIGLFAVPVDDGTVVDAARGGSTEGALLVEVPAGAWIVSAESWSPERRRAGRRRTVIDHEPSPVGVPVVSDLLLVEATPTAPASLLEALPHALLRPEIASGESLSIVWEVSGVGLDAETLAFAVSVERSDRSVFRRLGEVLRLTSRTPPVGLAWQEPGPERSEILFRHLELELPALDPGRYEVTLRLRTPGRADAVRRELRVR